MMDRSGLWACLTACALTLALLTGCGCDDNGGTATDTAPAATQDAAPTDAQAPATTPGTPVTHNTSPNAVHPIAGRSAFPELGEDLTEPIPAVVLSEQSQFLEAIDPQNIPAVVPWQQAGAYVGYEITVEGRIVAVGQTRTASINFLNFHEDWRGKFYMVLFKDLADTLDQSVQELFEGKMVHVTGLIEDHEGRPQLRIRSMDQVQFVAE